MTDDGRLEGPPDVLARLAAAGIGTVAEVLARAESVRDLPDRSNHVLRIGGEVFHVKRSRRRGPSREAAAIALAGPWLLPWLATADYRPPWPVFAGQALAVLLFGLYQILLYTLLLDGRSGRVLWMAMGAAAINAGLNLMLIPALGMSGAALAAALSNAALLAWAWPQARRALGRVDDERV